MLDKRDELLASIAKSMGLVSDAALSRAIDLKKRFPNQKLEQILESAGLITKEGKSKLAQAFNARVRQLQTRPAAPRPAAAGPTSAPAAPLPTQSQALLNSLHQSEPPSVDALASPPSEDQLTNDSSLEEQILAEPTIMLPDEELRRKPQVAAPPQPPRSPTEDELLAEPTLLVPDDNLISPASNIPSEEQILAEPTILVRDEKVDLIPDLEPEVPPDVADVAVPDDITVGAASSPSDVASLVPGAKKQRTGRLDRREFERRSKLRMGFEGMTIGDYEIEGELGRVADRLAGVAGRGLF